MNTVGTMLKEARVAKDISLIEVEKQTKIRLKFLEAIEADTYHLLPSPIYAKGFVKNYSAYLGLDSAVIMAFFRRQTDDVKRSVLLPKKSEDIETKGFRLTPGRFITFLLVGLSVLFISYFFIQYRQLQRPPELTITKPINESIVGEKKLDVFGETTIDATVTVNGMSVTVRSDGKFFTQVSLDPGVNTITVVSTSRFGKTKTEVRKVGLQQ
ncbi:MAG: helix-turn-helix domain-containing protein [Candidatus Gottesmanbacteria bacterium]